MVHHDATFFLLSQVWFINYILAKDWEEMTTEERRESLHFHDLRGTAITLLKIAGAEIPQICAITGTPSQAPAGFLRNTWPGLRPWRTPRFTVSRTHQKQNS